MKINKLNKDLSVKSIARPLFLKGGKKAVLIIHGYTAYPGEYYELAHALNEAGFTVSLPRLPGHGTNRRDFFQTTWRDWLRRVTDAWLDLKSEHEEVYIAGLSMGGVLALILAARFNPEKTALMAPAMAVRNKTFYLAPVVRFFVKKMKGGWKPSEIDSAEVRALGEEYWAYNFPTHTTHLYKLMRMAKGGLKNITSPVLILVSEADDTVPLKTEQVIRKGLNPRVKVQSRVFKNSPHVLLNGQEKKEVIKEVVNWFTGD